MDKCTFKSTNSGVLISRLFVASATLLVAGATIACSSSKKSSEPECPKTAVRLSDGWERIQTKHAGGSILIPSGAFHRDIPLDEKSLGEAWSSDHWNMYYKFDTVQTNHVVEPGPNVYNLLVCSDTVGGRDATITTLRATGTTLAGAFAQATWVLPHGHSLQFVVVAPTDTPRDSMIAVLRGIKLDEK
jgi:hypothetical protein